VISFVPTGIKRVLCLGAHSDDIEIGCGGTVLELIRRHPGLEVYWAVFSGNAQRRREARASARAFLKGAKVRGIDTASFRESYFPVQWAAIKNCVEKLRREFEPDLVFTHYRDDRHQDHRVLSDLAWNTFRNHVVLEYEIPKYDGDLGVPNVFMPLGEDVCRKKIEYLCQFFRTQSNKHWFTEDTFHALLRLRGIECAAESRYAEAFYGRKLVF
jgi:LmbE family N-acetylglucosaminyl deacetylase